MPSVMPKLADARAAVDASGLDVWLEVDGGIGPANAHLVRDAGVEVIVAGSAVFKAADRKEAVAAIKG